jgi:hypothetical protein
MKGEKEREGSVGGEKERIEGSEKEGEGRIYRALALPHSGSGFGMRGGRPGEVHVLPKHMPGNNQVGKGRAGEGG